MEALSLLKDHTNSTPSLWSGVRPEYGSGQFQLKQFALATRSYFVFHSEANSKATGTTRLGAAIKEANADKACLPGEDDSAEDKALKEHFWHVVSELFVKSWRDVGQFNMLLNVPPRFFKYTIMYKEELPQVRKRFPEWRAAVYVVNTLPRIEGSVRKGEKASDFDKKVKYRDENLGKTIATCMGYRAVFKEFGLHGFCHDCPNDDIAACATGKATSSWKIEKGGAIKAV